MEGLHPRNQAEGSEACIWQAARATSAALTYLKPMVMEGVAYEDGAVVCNDPSEELLRDVKAHRGIHENAHRAFEGSLILTLGTGSKRREVVGSAVGHGPMKNIRKTLRRVVEVLRNVATHRWVRERMTENANAEGYRYAVWDGGEIVGSFGLDDCGKFREMEHEIGQYMNTQERQEQLREVAEMLVGERRRRFETTPDRWQRFAHCTIFTCPHAHCPQRQLVFRTRAEARIHVDSHHHGVYNDPQGVVDAIPPTMPCLPLRWGPWCLEDPDVQAAIT